VKVLDWVADGQVRLQRAVDVLPPHAVTEPSALPGWTRGHLLTHLARNADALVNLLTWARTGIPTPMYASPDQRVFNQVSRALRRAIEDARPPATWADLAVA